MKYDLHAHTTASDGVLTPHELVMRAKNRGVSVLAVTDHDTTAGLEQAQASASEAGISVINGIELSVSWGKSSVHIVGLNINRDDDALATHIDQLQNKRQARAEKIAEKLEKEGLRDALEGASRYSANGNITRTHFARYIVESGMAESVSEVFKKYLSHGKPGYVTAQWLALEQAVSLINEAGGQAVVAHPARYRMTHSKLKKLLAEFQHHGGAGIEVINSGTAVEVIKNNARLAREFELLGSTGSDFHGPDNQYIDLGRFPSLPDEVTPIWHDWR